MESLNTLAVVPETFGTLFYVLVAATIAVTIICTAVAFWKMAAQFWTRPISTYCARSDRSPTRGEGMEPSLREVSPTGEVRGRAMVGRRRARWLGRPSV